MVKANFSAWASALCFLSLCGDVAAHPAAAKEECKADLKGLLTDPARHWAANTTVSFPGNAAFANATERWSIFNPPTYSAAVSPGTEGDVSKVVWKIFTRHMPDSLLIRTTLLTPMFQDQSCQNEWNSLHGSQRWPWICGKFRQIAEWFIPRHEQVQHG